MSVMGNSVKVSLHGNLNNSDFVEINSFYAGFITQDEP